MFIDANELPDETLLESDLVVVGGGAAGITLAIAYLGRPETITLIESGGFEYEAETQALYEGRNIGWDYFDFDISRLRYWGGSTNHWGARCRPLAAIDLKRRAWIEHSGWPIERQTLDPHYERAQEICGLGPYDYDLGNWIEDHREIPAFNRADFIPSLWQFGYEEDAPAINFGEQYRAPIAKSGNVTVVLHANLLEFLASENGVNVIGARARTLAGKRLTIVGQRYVLACGGLENPRLLLASNSVVSEGLGNQHDLVGRFCMDHPHLIGGQVITKEGVSLDAFAGAFKRKGHFMQGNLRLSGAFQRRHKVASLDFSFKADRGWGKGAAALRRLYHAWRSSRWPDDLTGEVADIMSDPGGSIRTALGFLGWITVQPIPRRYVVRIFLEQTPNPNNRIRLSNQRDALGMPRLELDWRLTHEDKHTVVEATRALANEVGRGDIGRLKIDDWVLDGPDAWPGGALCNYHHMGATRMADDPRRGVVDRDQRVHSMANLYIAGSSVFPTSGSANPTLTIVAMTFRLAEILQQSGGRATAP